MAIDPTTSPINIDPIGNFTPPVSDQPQTQPQENQGVTHDGITGPRIDIANMTGSFWRPYKSFAWNNSSFAQSFMNLPTHNLWIVVFAVVGGANNRSLGLKINAIGGTNYNHNSFGSTYANNTSAAQATIYQMTGVTDTAVTISINGKVGNSSIGYVGNVAGKYSDVKLGGGDVVASSDVFQIDLLEVGGDSANFTGNGVLYYQDLIY